MNRTIIRAAMACAMFALATPSAAQLEQIQVVPDTPDYIDATADGGSAMQFSNGDIGIVYKVQTDYSVNDFGPDRLFLIRSTDGGATWSGTTQIDMSADHQGIGGVRTAVSSSGRALIAYFKVGSDWVIRYSDDDGSSWRTAFNPPSFGETGFDIAAGPSVGNDAYFAATYRTSGPSGDIMWVRTSTDGTTWSNALMVLESSALLCGGTIEMTSTTNIIIAYEECSFGRGNPQPLMRVMSDDGGQTWSAPTEVLTSGSSFSHKADMVMSSGGTLWLVHTDSEDLHYTSSTDGGVTWAASTQWTDNTGMGPNPGDFDQDFNHKVGLVNDQPFVVFRARRGFDWFQLFYGIAGVSSDPLFVDVERVSNELPQSVTLEQNYPNPFNPSTQFTFAVPEAGHTRVTVFDLVGREVARLLDREIAAGTYEVSWSADELPSGPYVYRLEAASTVLNRKMLLLK